MWQPMEHCWDCGGRTIRESDDADPNVGYRGAEWRCMDCGALCEEWQPERKPATVETLPSDLERTLGMSLRIMQRLRFADAQARALTELLALVLQLPLSDEDLRRVTVWARKHSVAMDAARAARK